MSDQQLIAYLGPRGTYSEEMALKFYSHRPADLIPYSSLYGALQAVETGEAAEAIIPIENSLEGAVSVVLDVLAHDVTLQIVQELLLPIDHHLWVQPGTKHIHEILSHPQALGQCRRYISERYPDAKITEVDSTAAAAYQVASGKPHVAAIGSSQAGKIYNLEALQSSIQDYPNNCTRFVILRKKAEPITIKGLVKSSFVCNINGEKSGSLCDVLQEFSKRSINMTRIESRPTRNRLGEYLFFIDIVDDADSTKMPEALAIIEKSSLWYKHLGTYPVAEQPSK